jgi:hypothetical protein
VAEVDQLQILIEAVGGSTVTTGIDIDTTSQFEKNANPVVVLRPERIDYSDCTVAGEYPRACDRGK